MPFASLSWASRALRRLRPCHGDCCRRLGEKPGWCRRPPLLPDAFCAEAVSLAQLRAANDQTRQSTKTFGSRGGHHGASFHYRSGRQFLLQLPCRASPLRTLPGQELMDEPGVLEFVKDGHRYVTSSSAVATAFGAASAEGLANAVLKAIEKQF